MTEWQATNFVYVAEDEDAQIIGFASGGPEREADPLYDGELYAIYLLQQNQRRGIGRQLTLTIAKHLQQQGFSAMKVWLLAGNPARNFYEALGGQDAGRKEITISGVTLSEVAFGWPDIAAFLRNHNSVTSSQFRI